MYFGSETDFIQNEKEKKKKLIGKKRLSRWIEEIEKFAAINFGTLDREGVQIIKDEKVSWKVISPFIAGKIAEVFFSSPEEIVFTASEADERSVVSAREVLKRMDTTGGCVAFDTESVFAHIGRIEKKPPLAQPDSVLRRAPAKEGDE